MDASSLAKARARLIVALDVPTLDEALALADVLAGHVGVLKIGLQLFVAEGPRVVREIRSRHPDMDVFLDLKLHDIPNTMRGAIRSARSLGARFLTVHAGSGIDHLRACVDEAGDELQILAVTVLTSQDERACREAGHTKSPAALVETRAEAAKAAGCAGVVCSGQELARLQSRIPELLKVVPGIRPAGSDRGDQKRVMTPAEAIAAGASHLVVGRPVRNAEHKAEAADQICEEIRRALEA